jgi:dihydroxyacid dehydratase/phosphogluconate dehydratase
LICIDIAQRSIQVELDDKVLQSRLDTWVLLKEDIPDGFLRLYADTVMPANHGAVMRTPR